MSFSIPRTILFVPASRSDFFEKAARSDADAICFDLEDGVDISLKEEARKNLDNACWIAERADKVVMVRVNSEPEWMEHDLESLPVNCKAVLLPKAESLAHLHGIGMKLDRLATERGVDTALIGLMEDARALLVMEGERQPAHSRLVALCAGTEDLSNAFGCDADSRLIGSIVERLAVIASAHGVSLLGFPGSIANFADLERLRRAAVSGLECGSLGGLCIHPAQIDVLNEVFTPSVAMLRRATRIVLAFETGQLDGKGAVGIDGTMVDLPVYKRAKALLSRGRLILKTG